MMSLLSNFVSYITSPLYTLISSPTWFFSAPGKIFGLSVPWRVGAFTGLSLSVIVSVMVFLQMNYPQLFGDDQLFVAIQNPGYLALIALLVLAFSIVIGFATHFWLMDVPSRFPLIDRAWKRGVGELQVAGIDLTAFPLFVIVGISDTASAHALMQASGLRLGIKPPENESQPLLWFTAEKDGDLAIFLFLCTCCQTSLMSGGRGLEKERAVRGTRVDDGPMGTIDQAANSIDMGPMNSIAAASDRNPQTSVADFESDAAYDTIQSDSDSVSEPRPGSARPRGPQQTIDDSDASRVTQSSKPVSSVQRLTDKNASEAKAELQHVCQLLRTARQPYCPFNGIVATVPFQMLKTEGGGQGKNLGEVTRNDLTILTKELGLRAHVVAVVHGLDVDEDFRIFVKRMREFQSESDVDRRLGKGLSAWADGMESSGDMVAEVAHCSCDAFQRLIYKFFSSTLSLKKVDNGQLYRFLANIRGKVESNLREWLVDGFAPNDEKDRQSTKVNNLPQFAGCYFIAAQPQTSEMDDDERLYAHAPGVFERIFELEGEIEWTELATAKDLAYRHAANAFFVLTLAGILVIVVGLWGFLGKNVQS